MSLGVPPNWPSPVWPYEGAKPEMNAFHEAAIDIARAERRHPHLMMRMDVLHDCVRISGVCGPYNVDRIVTWAEIETARINVLKDAVEKCRLQLTRDKSPQSRFIGSHDVQDS